MKTAPFSVTPILILIYLISLVLGAILGKWFGGQGADGLAPAILCGFVPIAIAGKVRFIIAKKFNEIVKSKHDVPIAYPLHIRLLIGFAVSAIIAMGYVTLLSDVINGFSGAKLALLTAIAYTLIMYGKILIKASKEKK